MKNLKTKKLKKTNVSIDASFWINIVFLGLNEYLIKYFNIFCVLKVEKEIFYSQTKMYSSIDMDLFNLYKDLNLIIIKDPKKVSKKILDNIENNSGELYSIALCFQDNLVFLTDDYIPYRFCLKNNLLPINSIDFIYFLYLKKEINLKQVCIYLNKLNKRIKKQYILECRKKIKGE